LAASMRSRAMALRTAISLMGPETQHGVAMQHLQSHVPLDGVQLAERRKVCVQVHVWLVCV
jgi:hypothetical protein